MRRRHLPWAGLLVGVALIAAVPAWWVTSRPASSAGSLEALGPETRSSPPVVESPYATSPGSALLPAPGPRFELPEASVDTVAVRSALLDDLERPRAPRPVSLGIPALGVEAAVQPVGVDSDTGELEVPGDRATVGWYRHGPSPGQKGSAVLAGHVDYGEGRAVFYRLADLDPGALVTVGFGDGSERRFRVVARRLYGKHDLPARIFATSGRPVLTLMTCGGAYDSSLRSYADNVVVYAVPVDARA